MEKKNSMILIIITIAAFIGVTALATFAYFATNTRIDANIGVNVETAGASYTFTASGNGNINLPVTAVDMAESKVSTEKIKTGNGNIKVSLTSPNDETLTSCTYDIIWVWDSEDKYTTPDGTLPMTDNGKTYPYEFSTKVDEDTEQDLSTLNSGVTSNSLILKKGASITSMSTTATEQAHRVEANIYNLPVDQEKLKGKNFNARITIENVVCEMKDISGAIPLATHVKNQAITPGTGTKTAGVYQHSTDNLTNLPNNAQDDSYRYSGEDANVNNWVCFYGDDCTNQDNLYRIISVDSNNKIKVIKATNLGSKKWNEKTGYTASGTAEDTAMGLTNGSTYINIWAIRQSDGTYYTSSLNDYLNGEYLTAMEAKTNRIENTTWSVGGASYSNHLSQLNIHDFMVEELRQEKGTYNAKVGLVYAYEYGFAALPEFWGNKLYYSSSATDGFKETKGKDWLLTTINPWTISRHSSSVNGAFLLLSDRGYVYNGNVTNICAVRPVLGLSSSTMIINQNEEAVGSASKPMIII